MSEILVAQMANELNQSRKPFAPVEAPQCVNVRVVFEQRRQIFTGHEMNFSCGIVESDEAGNTRGLG